VAEQTPLKIAPGGAGRRGSTVRRKKEEETEKRGKREKNTGATQFDHPRRADRFNASTRSVMGAIGTRLTSKRPGSVSMARVCWAKNARARRFDYGALIDTNR